MPLLTLTTVVLTALPQGLTEVEPNDPCNLATAVAPTAGVKLHGALSAADVDHWQVSLPLGSFDPWYVWLDNVPGAEVSFTLATQCGVAPFSTTGENRVATLYENPAGGTYTLALRATNVPTAGVAYTLRLSSDPCEAFVSDRFEPNATFAMATPLPEFALGGPRDVPGLCMAPGDVDVFAVHLPAAATGTFLAEVALDATVTIDVFDAATGAPAPTTGGTFITVVPAEFRARDLFVRVTGTPTSGCSAYTLRATALLDPCGRSIDDALEGPDAFGTASPTALGTYPSLTVNEADPDAYAVTVPAGEAVVVGVVVTGPMGSAVELHTLATTGGGAVFEQQAATGERVQRLLVNGGTTPLVAQLGVATGSGCAGYELTLEAFGPGPVGASYCQGFDASGAVPAVLGVWPTPLAATGELALRATGLPAVIGEFGGLGTVLFGDAVPAQPGAPPGRCIGGATTRVPWFLEATGSSLGAAERIVDLGATSLGTSIVVGRTFTAQLWYRASFPASASGVTDAARFVVQ